MAVGVGGVIVEVRGLGVGIKRVGVEKWMVRASPAFPPDTPCGDHKAVAEGPWLLPPEQRSAWQSGRSLSGTFSAVGWT